MNAGYNVDARKRAVNLTLNEDLLAHVREVTDNLSSVVESLLAQYLATKRQERAAQVTMVAATVAMWNQFADENGSFADDHSTLSAPGRGAAGEQIVAR
jgi:antitoxin CcdA